MSFSNYEFDKLSKLQLCSTVLLFLSSLAIAFERTVSLKHSFCIPKYRLFLLEFPNTQRLAIKIAQKLLYLFLRNFFIWKMSEEKDPEIGFTTALLTYLSYFILVMVRFHSYLVRCITTA